MNAPAPTTRDVLTEEEAAERARRVSGVEYRIALDLRPKAETYRGDVTITFRLADAAPVFLDFTGHRVDTLEVNGVAVGTPDWTGYRLTLRDGLRGGENTVRVAYENEYDHTGEGFHQFTDPEDGEEYLYTNFEPYASHRLFPQFDQPDIKGRYTLTVTAPAAWRLIANSPEATLAEAPDGRRITTFERTQTFSTYLFALIAGPFEVFRGRWEDVALGFYARKSLAPFVDQDELFEVTRQGMAFYAGFFDYPYPFGKYDQVFVPEFNAGAMENVGAVTHSERLVFRDPPTDNDRLNRAEVILHELAHMWFGNLVTMRWWDDLWLNESFASWLGDRITAGFDPGWRLDTAVPMARQRAMDADQRPSARRVREPVRSDDDFGHLWDPITYEKGQVLLAMTEQWMGADRMREAMRRYIRRHAWGHADVDDLLRTLGEADADVPGMLRSYIHRTGVPQVQVSLLCDDAAAPRLQVRQSAWRSLAPGSPHADAAPPGASPWQIPLQVRTPGGLTRIMLRARRDEVPLPDTTCPAWVQANAGGGGYFRSVYSPALQQALWQRPQPDVAELLTDLDDALALSQSGGVPAAALLELVHRHANHADRRVVEATARLLKRLRPVLQSSDATAYALAWQAAFGERARKLGWQAAEHESADDRLLRLVLVPAVAELGSDAHLQDQALALARQWLAGGPAPEADIRAPLLATAAVATPVPALSLYEQMTVQAARTADSSEQSAWLGAAMRLREPELKQRALATLLLPTTDLTVALPALLEGAADTEEGRSAALRFIATHRAAMAARSGRDAPAGWPWYFGGACSMGEARLIEATFAPLAAGAQGGQRQLAQVLDGVRLCAAWRQAQAPG